MHGDFGFSNILFNARAGRIKTLNPRGAWNGHASPYGDTRYDLAKLAGSVVGRYDQIIAGRYCIAASGGNLSLGFETLPCQAWLQDALKDLSVDGVRGGDPVVRAVMVSLFSFPCRRCTPTGPTDKRLSSPMRFASSSISTRLGHRSRDRKGCWSFGRTASAVTPICRRSRIRR